MNTDDFKNLATESSWYGKFLDLFNCQYTTDSNDEENDNRIEDEEIPKNEANAVDGGNQRPSYPNNPNSDSIIDIENHGSH